MHWITFLLWFLLINEKLLLKINIFVSIRCLQQVCVITNTISLLVFLKNTLFLLFLSFNVAFKSRNFRKTLKNKWGGRFDHLRYYQDRVANMELGILRVNTDLSIVFVGILTHNIFCAFACNQWFMIIWTCSMDSYTYIYCTYIMQYIYVYCYASDHGRLHIFLYLYGDYYIIEMSM